MQPWWPETSLTMREARLLRKDGGETAEMPDPQGECVEDGPGGTGRRPYYAVPRLRHGFGLCLGRRPR